MQLTPSMQQYIQIKKAYQDCILLFQMGDFFETFFEDAKTVSKVLNIVLTSREKDNPIPMAGFPMKALDQYLPKLINAGFKVAIAKQIEDSSSAKGLVKRKVTEIVTKATLTTNGQLGKQSAQYIASFYRDNKAQNLIFMALTDIFSGTINIYTLPANSQMLIDFIRSQGITEGTILSKDRDLIKLIHNEIPIWPAAPHTSEHYKNIILKQFNSNNLMSLGIENETLTKAVGLLLDYLKYLKGNIPKQIGEIKFNTDETRMYLDSITIRNLDLLPNSKNQPTLLEIIDQTLTPMGYRLLYESIRRPLIDIHAINLRLNSIDTLIQNQNLQEKFSNQLKNISDIERLTGLIGLGKISPKQTLMLKNSLTASHEIFNSLPKEFNSVLKEFNTNKEQLIKISEQIISLISFYLRDDASNDPSAGPIINEENFNDIKELRNLANNAKHIIEDMLNDIKNKYNLEKLRLGMNKIYGYYLEIPKTQSNKLPAEFIRKQTLVNTERFITPELKELEDKIETAQLQLFTLEQQYFNELIIKLQKSHLKNLQLIYTVIAFIDFVTSGSLWAKKVTAIKPVLTTNYKHTIVKQGRHPVVESHVDQFIPNSIELNDDTRFVVLTGPNMGGKSTFIRQIALIQILAQIGYFVPAEKAILSIKDRIFARVGASDNIAEQMSTFMVEMSEISNIIKNATEDSLIILDEVGRGTSAWEGISLAYAISEYLITTIKAHTLFATHYFELTELEKIYPTVKNFKVDVFEDNQNVIFLHTVSQGTAQKSYGIHIAKMVNLPEKILKRAEEVLANLNQRNLPTINKSPQKTELPPPVKQPSLIQVEPSQNVNKIIKKLEKIDINNLTPLKALEILNELKTILSKI